MIKFKGTLYVNFTSKSKALGIEYINKTLDCTVKRLKSLECLTLSANFISGKHFPLIASKA